MIYYIHGFNSGIKENRLEELTNIFNTEVKGLTYDSGGAVEDNIKNLLKQIDNSVDLIIGTSLGGFYSQMLGNILNVQVIMINPCISPAKALSKYIGDNTNYTTGDRYVLSAEVVDTYPEMEFNTQTLAVLSTGDELFDYTESLAALYGRCEIYTYRGGRHSFNNYSEIKELMIDFLNSPVL